MNVSELKHGRPESSAGRLEKELRCYDLLDSLGIEYRRVDHDSADTIELCHVIEKTLGAKICKNLFLANRQQTEFYLLLMPGDKPFKTKLLSKQIGSSRLSFGTAENMLELLDITPGSVSVLGLINDKARRVKLIIDADLLKDETIGCHPCINSSTLSFSTSDLTGKLLPALGREMTVVELPWEVD